MKAEDKIYGAFFRTKLQKLYFYQLKEETKLSNSSLQNILTKLIKQNILKQEKTKQNNYYIIKNKKLFALKFSEIALNKFNNLNPNVKTPLRNFLKNIPQNIFTIILFGSASIKQEQNNSDIDLLVISENNINLKQNKKQAELTSKYEISIFTNNINNFLENKDDLVIQARKTGFPIFKEQNFYEVLLNE